MRDLKEDLWEHLTGNGLATEEELQLITSINGYNLDSLESVLYCRTGCRTLEQIEEMEGA